MNHRKSNFCSTSWMCKKQTSVSHSSTESEVISLGAGFRMDGIRALDLRDLVIEVLHSSGNTQASRNRSRNETPNIHTTTILKQRYTVTGALMSYPMWITLSQAQNLLNSNTSSTFWKTMKLWSKWSVKAEVRWWDKCPEPTESRWIGCLTKSIWIPKSKSNTSTPKINSQTS